MARNDLPEMPVSEARYVSGSASRTRDFIFNFPKIASQAAKFAYYKHLQHLVEAGFTSNEILSLSSGRVPTGISLWVKAPVEYGGTQDFSNMFFIRMHPYGKTLVKMLREQIPIPSGANSLTPGGLQLPRTLFVPNPVGLVFKPALKGIAGAGGATATDKMTQAGVSMFSPANQAAATAAAMAKAAANKAADK